MSKTIDITDKLSFEGNPKLIVRGVEIEVNTNAPTVLKFMKVINDEESSESLTILKSYELLFSEENREKIESLNLDFSDFLIVVKSAMSFIKGNSNKEGEE
jgi:hypothetical protein